MTSHTTRLGVATFVVGLLLASSVHAAAECGGLQNEVDALKARVLELQSELSSARTALPESAAARALPEARAGAARPVVVPGNPNKVTRSVVVVEEEAYSHAGCSLGLFKGTPPGRWKERGNWEDLEKGMPAAEVERVLGVEHYNVGTGSRVLWQYGKCEAFVRGQVLLVNGLVEGWRTPEF